MTNILQETLKGHQGSRMPIWFMRQAGRYLPEYKALRQQCGNFMDFCLNPVHACEATLQPLRRFDLDAAIVFADILLVPYALGQTVSFSPGHGPQLSPLHVGELAYNPEKLAPVYETLRRVRQHLGADKSLIGFCGAPWTVATYMIEGQGSKTYQKTKMFAYQFPALFQDILDCLADVSADYLIKQIQAGADVVKIFDSWASAVPVERFHDWVIAPTQRIIAQVKQACPQIPIMGFPKGAGVSYEDYLQTGVDAVTLDTNIPRLWARDHLGAHVVLQGGLDPVVVAAGGKYLDAHIDALLATFGDKRPYIFNLGHGFVPETPIAHVAHVIARVRNF